VADEAGYSTRSQQRHAPTDNQPNDPNMKEIEFTLSLNEEQQHFAQEYNRIAHKGKSERHHAGVEVERHGCGEVTLYITDKREDEILAEATFTPAALRDFTREVGNHWYKCGRLGEIEQNALHLIQLHADYADGEITKKDIDEIHADFTESQDGFVNTGFNSLRFRKYPDTNSAQ